MYINGEMKRQSTSLHNFEWVATVDPQGKGVIELKCYCHEHDGEVLYATNSISHRDGDRLIKYYEMLDSIDDWF